MAIDVFDLNSEPLSPPWVVTGVAGIGHFLSGGNSARPWVAGVPCIQIYVPIVDSNQFSQVVFSSMSGIHPSGPAIRLIPNTVGGECSGYFAKCLPTGITLFGPSIFSGSVLGTYTGAVLPGDTVRITGMDTLITVSLNAVTVISVINADQSLGSPGVYGEQSPGDFSELDTWVGGPDSNLVALNLSNLSGGLQAMSGGTL